VYHDLSGLATTTLSTDVQTSGAAVAGESHLLGGRGGGLGGEWLQGVGGRARVRRVLWGARGLTGSALDNMDPKLPLRCRGTSRLSHLCRRVFEELTVCQGKVGRQK